MPGLGEQRQAVCAQAGRDQQHDVGQRDHQRNPQDPRSGRVPHIAGVHVHVPSLEAGLRSIQPQDGCLATRRCSTWNKNANSLSLLRLQSPTQAKEAWVGAPSGWLLRPPARNFTSAGLDTAATDLPRSQVMASDAFKCQICFLPNFSTRIGGGRFADHREKALSL